MSTLQVLDYAKNYIKHGMSIIPATVATKQPAFDLLPNKKWSPFQYEIASEETVTKWFANRPDAALAVIGGEVSGGLIILDFDNKFGDAEDIFYSFLEILSDSLPDMRHVYPVIKTQSGGRHLYFRSPVVIGNKKLASRPNPNYNPPDDEEKSIVLIETRGEGGYALAAPSKGYTLIQGKLSEIPMVTEEEFEAIIATASTFNEYSEEELGYSNTSHQSDDGSRPGDDFNQRGDHYQLLTSHGWRQIRQLSNGRELWRRPGKDKGVSATYNFVKDKFYVFSTSGAPFQDRRSYDKFALYTILEHNGDFREATKALGAQGYGTRTSGNTVATRKRRSNQTAVNSVQQTDEPPKTPIHLAKEYIAENYEIKYNEVKSFLEIKAKEKGQYCQFEDWDDNNIYLKLKENGLKITKTDCASIINSEFTQRYNPFVEYFNNLPEWDGEDHIKNFLSIVKVKPNQIDDSTQNGKKITAEEVWSLYFTRWIIGVVATALERGVNHNCLVLVGGQGIGKTTIINRLIPPVLKNYLYTGALNPKDKDTKLLVSKNLLINLDELESTTREEIGLLKSLITLTSTQVRASYAKHEREYVRRASFAGSVNRINFLTDITGSRRFLCIEVESIDYTKEINIDQLYAQALFMLNAGVPYWFKGEEIDFINRVNKAYQTPQHEEELILKFFKPFPDVESKNRVEIENLINNNLAKGLTSTEIIEFLSKKTTIKLNANKLAQHLKNLGFVQKIVGTRYTQKRAYILNYNEFDSNETAPF